MKTCSVLSLIALLLTTKASAECWSERLGWPCCSKENTDVYYVDDDGEWGVENDDWCGMSTEEEEVPSNQGGGMPWGGDQGGGMPWGNQGGNQGGNPFGGQGGGMPWGGDQGGNPFGGQGGGMPWGNQGGNQGGNPFGGQGGGMPWGGDQGGNQGGGSSNYDTTPAASSNIDCSGKTLKSNTNLTINGRKVIVKFPSGYTGNEATPLLINYHPIGGSASQWEGGSQTAKAALSDGAIVAFMDGAQGPMGQAWNVGPCCTDADDVQFTRNFIKEITSKACVDPKRIYAAGFSMGGGMSNYAGCYLADVIAAAAPSAFDLAKEVVDAGKCKPARPFPILNFRGTQDPIVMYNGGLSQVVQGKPITFMGAKNNLKEWAKMNGCTGSPVQNNPGNNCEMYENCNGGAKVGLCTINGGSHSEGDGRMGWNFLKQFKLP